VDERILADMVLRMREGAGQSALRFESRTTGDALRACPSCNRGMDPVGLDGVALDRCAKHGIWFDAKELETALQRAGDGETSQDSDWSLWLGLFEVLEIFLQPNAALSR